MESGMLFFFSIALWTRMYKPAPEVSKPQALIIKGNVASQHCGYSGGKWSNQKDKLSIYEKLAFRHFWNTFNKL